MHCLCVWAHSLLLSAACHSTAEENKMENQSALGLCSFPWLWVRPQDGVKWWRPTELTCACSLMPAKHPTFLLISCLCLTWWIVPLLTVNKRCIYVNERERARSPMLCQNGVHLERIVFSTKSISWKTDRCHVCFEILGLQLNEKTQKHSFFLQQMRTCYKNRISIWRKSCFFRFCWKAFSLEKVLDSQRLFCWFSFFFPNVSIHLIKDFPA